MYVSSFFYDGYTTRTLKGKAFVYQLKKGQKICKTGITTGKTCGTISNTNYPITNGGKVGYYVHVRSNNGDFMAKGGDSGAPTYTSDCKAAGIVSYGGIEDTENEKDFFFMPIDRYSEMGLSVISDRFKITDVPSNWTFKSQKPRTVPIYFKGHPRFPVKATFGHVECPPGWTCKEQEYTISKGQASPIKIDFICSGSPIHVTQKFRGFISLTDSVDEHSSVNFNFTCEGAL